jgi:hypothetical protein
MSVRESRVDREKKDLRKSKKPLDKTPKMCYNEYIKGRGKAERFKKDFQKNQKNLLTNRSTYDIINTQRQGQS